MSEVEIWKDVPKFEGVYKVSNFGRIKSVKRKVKSNSPIHKTGLRTVNEKILNGWVSRQGYVRVNLSGRKTSLHRIVAEVFVSNPLDYDMVNHKDCNKQNNHASNLEWCTNQQNVIHAVQNNRGGTSKLTAKEVSIIRFFLYVLELNQTHISIMFNVARKTINDIYKGRTWYHYSDIASIDEVEKWTKLNKTQHVS